MFQSYSQLKIAVISEIVQVVKQNIGKSREWKSNALVTHSKKEQIHFLKAIFRYINCLFCLGN